MTTSICTNESNKQFQVVFVCLFSVFFFALLLSRIHPVRPSVQSNPLIAFEQSKQFRTDQDRSAVINRLSEGYQRVIRELSEGYRCVISRLSEGYQRVIRGLSESYQRVINGLSMGYQ